MKTISVELTDEEADYTLRSLGYMRGRTEWLQYHSEEGRVRLRCSADLVQINAAYESLSNAMMGSAIGDAKTS